MAIAELLDLLGSSMDAVRVDPSRTIVQLGAQLWTIVSVSSAAASDEPPSLRRGGAKHKQVR